MDISELQWGPQSFDWRKAGGLFYAGRGRGRLELLQWGPQSFDCGKASGRMHNPARKEAGFNGAAVF